MVSRSHPHFHSAAASVRLGHRKVAAPSPFIKLHRRCHGLCASNRELCWKHANCSGCSLRSSSPPPHLTPRLQDEAAGCISREGWSDYATCIDHNVLFEESEGRNVGHRTLCAASRALRSATDCNLHKSGPAQDPRSSLFPSFIKFGLSTTFRSNRLWQYWQSAKRLRSTNS